MSGRIALVYHYHVHTTVSALTGKGDINSFPASHVEEHIIHHCITALYSVPGMLPCLSHSLLNYASAVVFRMRMY